MVVQEKSETCSPGGSAFRIESLEFSRIPNQSKLFLQYQQDPRLLSEFYPNAVGSHTEISGFISEVLANYRADRRVICDALEETNKNLGAGEKTLANIELLRENDAVAVVTGQQAGLFSGPLYTVYKALSAVKLSECLRGRGIRAVPVFWIASEDHDFEEVSKTSFIEKNGRLITLKNDPQRTFDDLAVGFVKLDDSIGETREKLFGELPRTEFTAELKDLLDETWFPGASYSEAFGRLLAKIFEKYGLVFLDPLNEKLKRAAAPVYTQAVERSGEIVAALIERGRELEEKGYHAQVLIAEDYFPLFLQSADGRRLALKKDKDGTFKVKGEGRAFSLDELARSAESEPERFSPSVVLRGVVQDYLLPTVCYFGGGAEVAYFAQSAEVYRILGRPVTPVFHRQSFTFVPARHGRTLNKYDLNLEKMLAGKESVLPEIVEKFLNPEMARVFADAEERINTELNRLDRHLSELEPTLAESFAKRRQKIIYHIAATRNKFHRAQIEKDEIIKRRLETAFDTLTPGGGLQEREVNVLTFLNLYGKYFIDWIYEAVDLDDKAHRIVYL